MPKSNQPDPAAAKRQELKVLDEAIADRKKYLNDQEKLITDTVEAGNTKMMALIYDVRVAEQQLRNLKTDIRTAAQDKVLLNRELHNLQTSLAPTAGVAIPAFG